MFLLTTRSARFFLLLLHLVGVTTNFRTGGSGSSSARFFEFDGQTTTAGSAAGVRSVGVRGVYPAATVPLERTDPSWINDQRRLRRRRRLRRNDDDINNNDYDSDADNEDDGTDATIDDADIYGQPHWIQDQLDQKCLGPMSTFGECGDSARWRILPVEYRRAGDDHRGSSWLSSSSSSSSSTTTTTHQWIRWAIEDDDGYRHGSRGRQRDMGKYADEDDDTPQQFALQLVVDDVCVRNVTMAQHTGDATAAAAAARSTKIDEEMLVNTECLSRRRKDGQLVVVSCDQDRAWYWQINDVGVLHFEKPNRKQNTRTNNNKSKDGDHKRRVLLQKKRHGQAMTCLGRNSTGAIFLPCEGSHPSEQQQEENIENRVAPVRLVRQATTTELSKRTTRSTPKRRALFDRTKRQDRSLKTKDKVRIEPVAPEQSSGVGIPSHVDRVHAASTGKLDHADILVSTRLASLLSLSRSSAKVAKKIPQFLGDTNPILFSSTALTMESLSSPSSSAPSSSANSPSSSSTTSSKKHRAPKDLPSSSSKGQNLLHGDYSSSSSKPILRKIEFNPYIAASKDERWTDPQTGLVYPTDLCQYLGHDRKESGRHTLTGVGQYTKTMLKIKVYGVAFYVSKRDVLADHSFERFASMSTKELQQSPEFYQVLRQMTSSSNVNKGPAGNFDRTLFLKINMQLATDTMRSSLDADWKMLTSEDKALLIGSSMKERPADQRMLDIIASSDNPSKCSCAQIAPPEYNADPSCCARGTELVFTWRKNGDLEVRLNGRLMDSFPRPDIARGIFFEYLRRDDPMSLDFLDRVVDGFPFLLAPLSQVKGVVTPIVMHPTSNPSESAPAGHNFVFRTLGHFGGVLSSQASNFADFVQTGASEFGNSAAETARSMGDAARNLGEEMERRRDSIGKHMSAFTSQAMSSLYPKDKSVIAPFPLWISDSELDRISSQILGVGDEEYGAKTDNSLVQRLARAWNRFLGLEPSFNGVTGERTYATQKWLFGLVHLYLLLILIASFPEQRTKRAKYAIVFHKDFDSDAESHSDTEESDGDEFTCPPDR